MAVEKEKGEFNFSKLNYNIQRIYIRARSLASSLFRWLLRSREKTNSTFRRWNSKTWNLSVQALYPANKPKGEAGGLSPTRSTPIRNQPPDLFLPRIFVPKSGARALCQRLKGHSTQRKDANKIMIIIIIKGHVMYYPEKQEISNTPLWLYIFVEPKCCIGNWRKGLIGTKQECCVLFWTKPESSIL